MSGKRRRNQIVFGNCWPRWFGELHNPVQHSSSRVSKNCQKKKKWGKSEKIQGDVGGLQVFLETQVGAL